MRSARTSTPTREATAVTDAVLTASRLLIAVSASSIATVDDSITIPQFRMLVVLRTQGPMRLSTLAEHLGVQPSAATRMVDRLIAADLIVRQANPATRREIVLDLTENGTRTVAKVSLQHRRQITKIMDKMPDRHRTHLIEALDSFNEAGGESPDDEPQDDYWL
jgi:DNA-binding MarR family transcriptional regulator